MTPRFIVTLVHGTQLLGSTPTWLKNSELRTKLDELGHAIEVREIHWSGRNSHAARLEAAALVASDIQDVRSDPRTASASHFIIAHSHGGNAALYALRDLGDDGSVAGLVCLSTPFIHARPRLAVDLILTVAVAGIMCLATAAVVIATADAEGVLAFVARIPQGDVKWWYWLVLFLWIMVLGLVSHPLNEFAEQRAKRLHAELSLPNLRRTLLLVMQSPADEAHGGLKSMQFGGWLASLVNRRLTGATEFLVKHGQAIVKGGIAFLFLLIALLLSIVDLETYVSWQNAVLDWWTGMTGFGRPEQITARDLLRYGYVTVGVVLVAASVLGAFLVGLSIFASSWFGFALGLSTIHLELSAEANPPGRHETHQLTFPTKRPDALQHCAIYNDDDACEAIVEWLHRSAEAHLRMVAGRVAQ